MKDVTTLEGLVGDLVLDFHASWCGPCKGFAPIFARVEADFPGVTFLRVDVDDAEELTEFFQITSIPSVVFVHEGVEANRVTGAPSEAIFRAELKKLTDLNDV